MKDEDEKIWYLEDVTSTSVHETNFAVTGYLEDSAHWSISKDLIWKLVSFRHPKSQKSRLFLTSTVYKKKLQMVFWNFGAFKKKFAICSKFWVVSDILNKCQIISNRSIYRHQINLPGVNRMNRLGQTRQSQIFLTWMINVRQFSEWIYEVIVSPRIQTKKCQDFCPYYTELKSWQSFVRILEERMTSWIHSEIFWPLPIFQNYKIWILIYEMISQF